MCVLSAKKPWSRSWRIWHAPILSTSTPRHVRPVSEKAVEQELAHLARTHTVYQHTVAAAQRGDRVVLDFEGFMNGQSLPDRKMEQVRK